MPSLLLSSSHTTIQTYLGSPHDDGRDDGVPRAATPGEDGAVEKRERSEDVATPCCELDRCGALAALGAKQGLARDYQKCLCVLLMRSHALLPLAHSRSTPPQTQSSLTGRRAAGRRRRRPRYAARSAGHALGPRTRATWTSW